VKARQRSDKLTLPATRGAMHSPLMDRTRSDSGWRASAVVAALFAITINFLQPLAHAALIREGVPSALWGALCSAAAADPGTTDKNSKPVTVDTHECCLGLAHAVAFTTPSSTFITVEPIVTAAPLPPAADQPSSVGIRDGPAQPRGPPSFA
jgi:hypothetical protein